MFSNLLDWKKTAHVVLQFLDRDTHVNIINHMSIFVFLILYLIA